MKRKYPRKPAISSGGDGMCKSDINNQNSEIVIDSNNLKSKVREEKKLDPYKELIIELLNKGNTHEKILNILKKQGYDGQNL